MPGVTGPEPPRGGVARGGLLWEGGSLGRAGLQAVADPTFCLLLRLFRNMLSSGPSSPSSRPEPSDLVDLLQMLLDSLHGRCSVSGMQEVFNTDATSAVKAMYCTWAAQLKRRLGVPKSDLDNGHKRLCRQPVNNAGTKLSQVLPSTPTNKDS